MNLNNVYDYDGSFSDNPAVLAMYEGITTTLDEYYDSLQAPPLSALLMPQDLDAIHRVITSAKLSGNGEKRIFAIRDIMARRGFTQLAGGTNRSVFTHPNYPNIAVKVAIDNVGIHDNPAEYNNQFILKPYCTKCFEVSADGAVGVFEKVGRIRNSVEFYQMWDDIYSLCEYFVTEKELLLEDFGIKFFMNWGIRYGFGPVLLDFPYVYDIDWDKLHCDRPNDDGTICNGNIDYDDRFDFLVCEKCGKRYRAVDIAKKREVGKGVLTKISGGKRMQITLKRGNEVIKTTDELEVTKTMGKPAVAKSWRNKIMSNEAAGISSDSVKIRLVRGGTEIASYQADKVVKEDFGLVVKVTRGEEEVATTTENHNIVSDVEENSGLVVKVTRETEPVAEETPVVEDKVEEAVAEKETVEDSKDQDNVFAVRGKIVNSVDSIKPVDPDIEFVATDINEQYNKILENMDENHVVIVDKASADEEIRVETSVEELDKEMAEAEADAQAESIEDIDEAFNHIFESLKKNSIASEDVSEKKEEEVEKVEQPVVETVEAVIEEKLENSNSKRPAKKAKKSSSKKVEEKPKASKKKPVAKKTTKVSKPVEVVEDPEDPKPALDTSTDTELLADIAATLDPYEAPIETEAEVAHDMIAEMVASKEPIALELIRDSDTKVTVDDILKNY
jgi:enolase-phosphatase E1